MDTHRTGEDIALYAQHPFGLWGRPLCPKTHRTHKWTEMWSLLPTQEEMADISAQAAQDFVEEVQTLLPEAPLGGTVCQGAHTES